MEDANVVDSWDFFLSVCCQSLWLRRKKLLDEKEKLHERYAALFGLRNRGGMEAVDAIIASLKCKSELLKHEVAYVLGQLEDKASTNSLISTLKDITEHPMVRHEATEALGSVAGTCCRVLNSELLCVQFQFLFQVILSVPWS